MVHIRGLDPISHIHTQEYPVLLDPWSLPKKFWWPTGRQEGGGGAGGNSSVFLPLCCSKKQGKAGEIGDKKEENGKWDVGRQTLLQYRARPTVIAERTFDVCTDMGLEERTVQGGPCLGFQAEYPATIEINQGVPRVPLEETNASPILLIQWQPVVAPG